ncbi:MAG TPA: cache domain-containing protein [Desulfomonilaceae bacterium]|nr:cache domain-containing protein [Desulfomonilaceae bacterium]
MKKLAYYLLGALLVLCAASIALADQAEEVKEMVDKAADLFAEKGNDYALKLLNSSSGPFRKGEVYVFAINMEGITLAHPVNRDLVGQSVMDLKDANGKFFSREFIEVAKTQGAGWVDYWWLRHGEKEPTLKRSYIRNVPGQNVVIGAGYYVK